MRAAVIRKFLLTGLALLFMPDSATQIVFALLIVLLSAVAVLKLRPYVFELDNTAVGIAHWALFFQLFAGLLLKVDIAEQDDYDVDVLGILIAVVIIAVPFLVIVAAGMELAAVVWEDYIENHEDVDEWQMFLLPFLQRWAIVCRCGKPPIAFNSKQELITTKYTLKGPGTDGAAGSGSGAGAGAGVPSSPYHSHSDNPLDTGSGSSPMLSEDAKRKAAARARLRNAFKRHALERKAAADTDAAADAVDAAIDAEADAPAASTASALAQSMEVEAMQAAEAEPRPRTAPQVPPQPPALPGAYNSPMRGAAVRQDHDDPTAV